MPYGASANPRSGNREAFAAFGRNAHAFRYTVSTRTRRALIRSSLLLAAIVRLHAEVSLSDLFSDHMVLQRDTAVPVWGRAAPQEEVVVSIEGQKKSTRADANGDWRVLLDPMPANHGTRLSVSGANTIVLVDVGVGEVWLCSGQSNMGFRVSRASDAKQLVREANGSVRQFAVESPPATSPQKSVRGRWVPAAPETVGMFSAVAYCFARELQSQLGVPVGIINSSVGGTLIEAWTSLEAQRDLPGLAATLDVWEKRMQAWDPAAAKLRFERAQAAYPAAAAKAKAAGTKAPRPPRPLVAPEINPDHPGTLFNGMIAPLAPYGLRGVIWYQGESNGAIERAYLYRQQLPLLVADWRRAWGRPDLPFAWVQLPNIVRDGEGWPLVREAMLRSLALPHTGMAVTIDLGEADNLHPPRKHEIAQRLAGWALADVYGHKDAVSSGPLPDGTPRIEKDRIVVAFQHASGGLVAKNGSLSGFEIAGAERAWHPAHAIIEQTSVRVSSPDVLHPVAVRYAWKDNPVGGLSNGAGLPASPFRTDDWPIVGANTSGLTAK